MTFFFYFLIGCLFLLTIYRLLFVIASLFYTPPQPKEQGKELHMAFFVLCKNEEKNIKNTRDNLFSLSSLEETIDIYVYDDASTDHTKELILNYRKKNLFPIFNTGKSIGKANALVEFLKKIPSKNYDYIFVVDADHTLDKKAMSNIIKYFSFPRVAAVSIAHRIKEPLSSHSAVYCYIEEIASDVFNKGRDVINGTTALTGVWVARYDVLKRMYSSGWILCDDMDFTINMVLNGYIIRYASDIISYHTAPATMKGYIDQHVRWNRGFLQVFHRKFLSIFNANISFFKRIQLLVMSSGYIDRIIVVSIIFILFGKLLSHQKVSWECFSLLFYFGTIGLQVSIGLMKSPISKVKFFKKLYVIGTFYILDVFSVLLGACLSILKKPLVWNRTERSKK